MQGLLIGGTSHCGKSTLAQHIGTELRLPVQSTDQLARHPGRPWVDIPAAVAEFYESLSPETIYWFLRVHHTNMWPLLRREIEDQLSGSGGFVMEGSALRPESVAGLDRDQVIAVCLHADNAYLIDRIRRESDYAARDARIRRLIDIFITRSTRDNDEVVAAARQRGVWLLDAGDAGAVAEAADSILERMRR